MDDVVSSEIRGDARRALRSAEVVAESMKTFQDWDRKVRFRNHAEAVADGEVLLQSWKHEGFRSSTVRSYAMMLIDSGDELPASFWDALARHAPADELKVLALETPTADIDLVIGEALRSLPSITMGLETSMLLLLANDRLPLWVLWEAVDIVPYLNPQHRVTLSRYLHMSANLPVEVRARLTQLSQWSHLANGWLDYSVATRWDAPPETLPLKPEILDCLRTSYPDLLGLPGSLIVELLQTQEVKTPDWRKDPVAALPWAEMLEPLDEMRRKGHRDEGWNVHG